MMFFSGLLFFFGLLWLVGKLFNVFTLQPYHLLGTYATAIMFIMVGIMHFKKKEMIEAMIPSRLQQHAHLLNYGSGILEIVLGLLLFLTPAREIAAWSLMVLLVLIFPANIHVAQVKPDIYNISRLFFQPVYIAWIWFFIIYLNE